MNTSAGNERPSVQVNGETIRVGPTWFLVESDFEISESDELSVVAAPALNTADGYLYAVSIRNITTAKEIQLRADSGYAWARRGPTDNSGGTPAQQQAGSCGFLGINEVTGSVSSMTIGVGLRQPNMVLNVNGQSPLTIKLGPHPDSGRIGSSA